jgi:hypothetical protein
LPHGDAISWSVWCSNIAVISANVAETVCQAKLKPYERGN